MTTLGDNPCGLSLVKRCKINRGFHISAEEVTIDVTAVEDHLKSKKRE